MGGSGSSSAVVIASAGRAAVLERALDHLAVVKPAGCVVIVSVPDGRSLPAELPPGVIVCEGVRGAAAQRNAGLDLLPPETEVVYFFDDDALPHTNYFSSCEALLRSRPEVIAATGRVLADGARTGEIAFEDGLRLLNGIGPAAPAGPVRPAFSLYGCNFVVRASVLSTERFDPRLPLYSWLEDLDLSRRLARHGELVVLPDAVCVHLGSASGGRTSHLRYGYSQVANPVYLRSKRSITLQRTAFLVLKPALGNLAGSLRGSGAEDRRRRLLGNFMAGVDVLRGRIRPERIIDLPADARRRRRSVDAP